MAEQKRNVLSASTLIGDDVKNAQDENIGELKEIMIDLSSGKVAYAVLSFGGFLGLGDKYFAIPWDSLYVDQEEKCIRLNVDKERLKNAPGFDKDNWPDMSDPTWANQVTSYYGDR